MKEMLRDVTLELDNGHEIKRFAVRCMRRGSKNRAGEFGVLDILRNTFVLYQHGRSREDAEKALNNCTVDQYMRWARMIDTGVKRADGL